MLDKSVYAKRWMFIHTQICALARFHAVVIQPPQRNKDNGWIKTTVVDMRGSACFFILAPPKTKTEREKDIGGAN